jgi:signal transduction histidine kinase
MIRCNITCDEELNITISDNGKGFDLNRKYVGNGLSNMKFRADEITFFLDIRSLPGEGTVMTVSGRP